MENMVMTAAKLKLHPDLQSSLYGTTVHHPLCIWLHYDDDRDADLVNRGYLQLEALADEALEQGEWLRYLFIIQKPYRISRFYEMFEPDSEDGYQIGDREYWDVLGTLYIDVENNSEVSDELRELLYANREHPECIMTAEEQSVLASLPNSITVYRGCQRGENEDGWSWTLDREKAVWFATRFGELGLHPVVVTAKVEKRFVVAYFGRRHEEEIVVDPELVTVVAVEDAGVPAGQASG